MIDSLIVAYAVITMLTSFSYVETFLRRFERRMYVTFRPGWVAVLVVPAVYLAAIAYSLFWPLLLLRPLNNWFWPWFARRMPNIYLAVVFSALRMKDFR